MIQQYERKNKITPSPRASATPKNSETGVSPVANAFRESLLNYGTLSMSLSDIPPLWQWLLDEYSLRYGVGALYRILVYPCLFSLIFCIHFCYYLFTCIFIYSFVIYTHLFSFIFICLF